MTAKRLEWLQKHWSPRRRTGKTRFNREKRRGEDWTQLRETYLREHSGERYLKNEPWVKEPSV